MILVVLANDLSVIWAYKYRLTRRDEMNKELTMIIFLVAAVSFAAMLISMHNSSVKRAKVEIKARKDKEEKDGHPSGCSRVQLSEFSGLGLTMNLMDAPRYLIELLARIEKLEAEVERLKE
jgi:hypothetical protein